MELGVGDRLNIKLAFAEKQKTKPSTYGLAGSTINGTMWSRNRTAYSNNGSEHDLFYFGESCEFYLSLLFKIRIIILIVTFAMMMVIVMILMKS